MYLFSQETRKEKEQQKNKETLFGPLSELTREGDEWIGETIQETNIERERGQRENRDLIKVWKRRRIGE